MKKQNILWKRNPLNFLIILISILPISLLAGSAIININVILINFIFLYIVLIYNHHIKIRSSFYILIFFWFSLLINLFFSIDLIHSLSRSFGIIRFIILALSIKFVIEYAPIKKTEKIFFIWTIIFIIVSLDLIFEYFFGFNTLGFTSNFPGRLSGFMADELKIGHYYFALSIIVASYIFNKTHNYNLLYILLFFFVIISLLIGERSNFIKLFLSVIIFLFLFEQKNYLKKIVSILIIIISLITFINFNSAYKERFWSMFGEQILKEHQILKVIKESPYGGHWYAAWEIFLDNKIFGVGLKNFRITSGDEKYYNQDVLFSEKRQNTHPHQIHLEFLSETGLFGYFFFITFIILSLRNGILRFLKYKNLYQLSSLLVFFSSTILFLPSGSFFTTYGACIFWMIYGILISNKRS